MEERAEQSIWFNFFPLLTNYMSVEDYGTVDYLLVLSNLIAIFCIFGQDSAVGRYFYEYEDLETSQTSNFSITYIPNFYFVYFIADALVFLRNVIRSIDTI